MHDTLVISRDNFDVPMRIVIISCIGESINIRIRVYTNRKIKMTVFFEKKTLFSFYALGNDIWLKLH